MRRWLDPPPGSCPQPVKASGADQAGSWWLRPESEEEGGFSLLPMAFR